VQGCWWAFICVGILIGMEWAVQKTAKRRLGHVHSYFGLAAISLVNIFSMAFYGTEWMSRACLMAALTFRRS
jgi:hypothetical protein